MPTKDKKTKSNIDQQYFKEARGWDIQLSDRIKKSERTAWFIAITATIVALAQGIGISLLLPLKTVEPYVIKVDKTTGLVDIISRLDTSKTIIDEDTQEVIDKYWIHKYLLNRESYSWSTLEPAREAIGILSSADVQAEYAHFNNPKFNAEAPVSIYGYDVAVDIAIKTLTFIKSENIAGVERKTALIRIIKTQRKGSYTSSSHWQVTLTFAYFNTPTEQSIRYLNPFGFQVLFYRIDPETLEQ